MIKDIMSNKIIFGDINDTIKQISNLMKENNIGFIPIKENDKYIGVITDRDICIALTDIKDLNDSIKDYITNNIYYINTNDSISSALEVMSKYKVKRLLVKENDLVVGVVSISDILNNSNDKSIIKTLKSIFHLHNNIKNKTPEIDSFYL